MGSLLFHLRPSLLKHLKKWEGFQPSPYRCPGGWLTVGYGHVIREKGNLSFPLTKEAAEALLMHDILLTAQSLQRLIHVPLTPGQYDALLSFTFNVGAAALQRSTLRRQVNRGEYEDAPHQLLRWVWAGGRKHRGLLLRRQSEGALWRGL